MLKNHRRTRTKEPQAATAIVNLCSMPDHILELKCRARMPFILKVLNKGQR